ncbi:PLP-dependent aminotransferase family protein [Paraflavitalea sp. CAU 1676]|uniref:aminotransferase-like domain-containing protein n=1 Tax=Paraflavitalea sp. CAU 1676 TaxID=3032598 RepID=UPI0023DA48E1|nr:PLP-dependent aminotransferase family protein [Paraflavitalea sp. CAU 1676]MDF2193553.1 PLP-dependent aminotransferase family protein [Paraflavitalea sp. CAU 1676]
MHSPLLDRLFSNITTTPSAERAQYLQLADGILRLIKQGKLRPEQKLPGSRELATLLNLNRITINRALEELQIQGWLESFVGKGTFVSAHIPEHEPVALHNTSARNAGKKAGFDIPARDYLDRAPTLINTKLHLDDGFPDPRLAPLQELYRAYRSQLTRSGLYHNFGSYSQPDGPLYYKTALSNYLNETRGLKTTARNILSVRGAVMGINLVCNGLLTPGDNVVSGIPGWGRAERNFIHAGAKHIGISVDEHGLVVDELRKICKRKKIRMVYVTPHHHYPTTVPLRIDRRLELLQLSYEYGFIIFEDDYDFDFHYRNRPLLPLASADEQGMVLYCGSFSKSFSPGFRMGYLAASENVIEHLSRVRILIDRQGDHMLDMAMGELLNSGTIQRYLRKTLSVYRDRRDHCCQLLQSELGDAVSFDTPEGGLTVWTTFAPGIVPGELARKALQKGLYISNGSAHQYPQYQTNSIRLGFASSTPEEMAASIAILKQLM